MADYRVLNDQAYEYLRDMIYKSELEFRKIYSETKLAKQLDMSRTPIRDALNRLAHERFIDILPNRGFVLHTPTRADMEEAGHIRLMTEGYCAGVLAGDYPGEKARQTVRRMEEALAKQHLLLESCAGYSIDQFWLDDLVFHRALLEHLGISSLLVQYDTVMHIFMPHHLIREPEKHQKDPYVLERHRCTLEEHAAILRAVTQGGGEKAVQDAVRTHIRAGLDALIRREEEAEGGLTPPERSEP